MDLLVNVDVSDLERAVDFYQRAVGLRLARLLFEGTVAEMSGAAAPIYLLAKDAGSSANSAAPLRRDYARHWTPLHLDFVVDDLDAAVARARDAGAVLEGDVQSFRWGRQAVFADPFGHGFCLVEWAGRGYGEEVTP